MNDGPLIWVPSRGGDVPVIIEQPEGYPWQDGERLEYAPATEEEYAEYIAYWDRFYAREKN
jgi:hypothetical protein